MSFNSFIISRKSIVGRHSSFILSSESAMMRSIELNQRKRAVDGRVSSVMEGLTPRDDTSWFRIDDPNVDPVEVMHIIEKIPYGSFQKWMILIYLTLFISTSTLAYNFAFFLLPHSYRCPVEAFQVHGNSTLADSRML
jgi:hypothetical protein